MGESERGGPSEEEMKAAETAANLSESNEADWTSAERDIEPEEPPTPEDDDFDTQEAKKRIAGMVEEGVNPPDAENSEDQD